MTHVVTTLSDREDAIRVVDPLPQDWEEAWIELQRRIVERKRRDPAAIEVDDVRYPK